MKTSRAAIMGILAVLSLTLWVAGFDLFGGMLRRVGSPEVPLAVICYASPSLCSMSRCIQGHVGVGTPIGEAMETCRGIPSATISHAAHREEPRVRMQEGCTP